MEFSKIAKVLAWPLRPIQENFVFFIFMFALGYLCTQLEITLHLAGAKPYELSAPELFFDLYVLCFLLMWIPEKARRWIRWVIAIVLYAIALIDMFCYVRFESTLTPTMLMLAEETDGRETTEFFHSYVGWDLLTTKVGWVLLVFVMKESYKTYHVFCEQLEVDTTLPRKAQAQDLADRFASRIEDMAEKHPYQWFNFYDFWGSEK